MFVDLDQLELPDDDDTLPEEDDVEINDLDDEDDLGIVD